jgi:hypothetical protein
MHAVDDDYFLNMHGIHNAHLIHETLPWKMTIPWPYLSNRLAKHKELAAQLWVSGLARRAETLVRCVRTLQRNNAAKASQSKQLTDNAPPMDESDDGEE